MIKKLTAKVGALAALALFTVPFLSTMPAHAAGGATFAMSPASSTLTVGDSVTVTISVVAGSNSVPAAQVCVSYDSSKLSLTGTSPSGSPLNATTPSGSDDCTGGEAMISRYAFPPAANGTGTFTLGTFTFKSLAAGSVHLTYGSQSYIYDTGGSPIMDAGSGTSTITINAPAAPSGGSGTSGGTSGTTGTTNTSSGPTGSTNTSTKPKTGTTTTPQATATADPTDATKAETPSEAQSTSLATTASTTQKATTDDKPASKSKTGLVIAGSSLLIVCIGAGLAALKFGWLPFIK